MKYLTIAIPTYNGARTINQCIDSFKDLLTDEVEVIISDNASVDGTGEQVKKYLNNPSFKYFLNEKNVGMDANFDLAVRRSNGKFVWILSDDDIVENKEIITILLKTIKENIDNSVIYLNYNDKKNKITKNYFSVTGDDFFRITNFKSTLISSTVVNKEIWDSIDKTPFYGLLWLHICYLVIANSKHKTSILHATAISQIVYERKDRRWGANGTFFNVGLDLAKVYSMMPEYNYEKDVCRKAMNYVYKSTFFKNIIYARFEGFHLNKEVFQKCLYFYGKKISLWFINMPLFLLPIFIFHIQKRIKKVLKKRK